MTIALLLSWATVAHCAFPVTSTGDLSFTLDVASFPHGADSARSELYVEVLDSEIRFESNDEGYEEAELTLAVSIKSTEAVEIEDTRKVDIRRLVSEGTGAVSSEVMEFGYVLAAGQFRVTVTMVDERSRKFSIAGHLGAKREGTASGTFRSKTGNHSDIEFAKAIDEAASSDARFLKGDKVVVPNPRRLYGKRLPELVFYAESLLHGNVVGKLRREDQSWDVPVGCFDGRCFGSLDVTGFAPGRYILELFDQAGKSKLAWAMLDIAWSDDIWEGKDDEIISSLLWLATEDELAAMNRLSAGERERYLVEFWRVLDPDPSTTKNELKEKYLARVKYADTHFASGRRRGAHTDRGKIYIKYGPADEIVDRPESSGGFMAKGFLDVDLDPEEALDGEIADRPSINDPLKSYEIWKYDDIGDPLPSVKKLSSGIGMKFIFTDRGGFGDYELTYSSEMGEY